MASDGRVLGVGVGLFVILFFLVVCLVICAVGSKTTKPAIAYAGSTGLFVFVVVVLFASPRGPDKRPNNGDYDQTIIPMIIILLLMIIGAVAAGLGMIVHHLKTPVYAKRLNYYTDVLRQR
ncbi:hypothetical protein WJX72_009284 [[Myrmecia] bisecta]|uniref:Transmembrane protein 218 n=1 Tax=[Myrmecia] bisecta TaxID=41462 RepID=A0AAW1R9I0_9CHLO